MKVIVCGYPGSGHRLLVRFCRHHDLQAHMFHGNHHSMQMLNRWVRDPGGAMALIPVRHAPSQRASAEDAPSLRLPVREYEDCHRHAMEAIIDGDVPYRLLSYEAIVQDPEGMGRVIADWLGVEYRGWPVDIHDANAERGLLCS